MELIVFDLDGTLLNRQSEVSEHTRETLRRLGDRSIAYTVATGRTLHAARDLLADVWRINHDPETNSLAVHVARVRAKLDDFGLAQLVQTHPDGGYFIDAPKDPGMFRFLR